MQVVILTTGLSGSSLVTGLIGKAGLSAGETVVKQGFTGDYDTYENHELVALNDAILDAANEPVTHLSWYQPGIRARCAALNAPGLEARCVQMLSRPDPGSKGVLLKDPKLWMTVGFWEPLLTRSRTKIVIVYRESFDLWVSQTNKRIIYDPFFLYKAEKRSRKLLEDWLQEKGFDWLELNSGALMKNPACELGRLNRFLGTGLTLRDYREVCKPKAGMSLWRERLLAFPIFLRNYQDRIRGS